MFGSAFQSAFFEGLKSSERILIAGAGGGFDIYAGLPLFYALRRAGKSVFLANLSFTYLGGSSGELLYPNLWRVDHTEDSRLSYFPERYLSQFLHAEGLPDEIYAFDKAGVRPLRAAYQWLHRALAFDTVILVDGGTDILMRGDETGLGTPAEDMSSLAAVNGLPVKSFVACLGFGIDAYHGVCHAQFLENVAALECEGGFLGTQSLDRRDPSVAPFLRAVAYAHEHMPDSPSIVNGSIASALEGRFGDVHHTARTAGSQLFINPLMTLYWYFDLQAVAAQNLYLPLLEDTDNIFSVLREIEAFRQTVPVRKYQRIPV